MENTGKLKGKTLFITGASRGIGKAIALKAAADGANIVIAAKTTEPQPKLSGTIYTAAQEIEIAGGHALPLIVDVQNEQQVRQAVQTAVNVFGGIDIVVNNASAISVTPTLKTDMKRYDLLNKINTRGTFLVSKECLPHLLKSQHAHVLNISPPLVMSSNWFAPHLSYTISKFGMSMCVLGMAEEFKNRNIAVNALWPRTIIGTAGVELMKGKNALKYSRKPDIMADAAYVILCQKPQKSSGNFYIDEEILIAAGVQDFKPYACFPEHANNLALDSYLPKRFYAKM